VNAPSDDVVTEHVEWVVASITLEEAIIFAQDHDILRASEWVWVRSEAREVRAFRLAPSEDVRPFHPVGRGEPYVPRLTPTQTLAGYDHPRWRPATTEEARRRIVDSVLAEFPSATAEARDELERYARGELAADEARQATQDRVRRHFAEQRAITEALARLHRAHSRLLHRMPFARNGALPLGVNHAWFSHFVELADDAGLDLERIDAVAVQIEAFAAGLEAGHLPPFKPDLVDRETYIRDLVDGGPEWPDRRDEAMRLLVEGGAI
jgi:hypothetical protein